MTRIVSLAAVCGPLLAGACPAVAAEKSDAATLAPIGQFVDGMNAGDVKKAEAAYAPSPSIVDEFGPHHWTSFADWVRDFGAMSKTEAVTDFHIGVSPASFKDVDAHYAYAVVPSVLTYKVKGKATSEKGMFTFSLANSASGWHITAWAWPTL